MLPDETMAMVPTLWKIRNDNSETHIFNIGVLKSDEGVSNDILHIVRCFITKMSNLCDSIQVNIKGWKYPSSVFIPLCKGLLFKTCIFRD